MASWTTFYQAIGRGQAGASPANGQVKKRHRNATALGVDARKALTGAQVTMIAGWGQCVSDTVDQQIALREPARLAAAVKDADGHLHRMKVARIVREHREAPVEPPR